MATARTTKSPPPPAKKPARRAPAKAKAKRLPTNVVELGVPLATLEYYPGNPRRGDIDAIKRLMKRRGWWGAAVAQVSTRRILAGNHRLRARAELAAELAADPEVAVREKWHPLAAGTDAPVLEWQDVDDAAAAEIVAGDNRAADMAANDPFDLHTLLSGMDEEALAALSYSSSDLEAMLAMVRPPTLDELTGEHGEYDEADHRSFWPRMLLQLSPDTLARFNQLRLSLVGGDGHDEEFVLAVLERMAVSDGVQA